MPYASKAQQGYFHAHKTELEKQGVDVGEWDSASKGKSLPERAGMKAKEVNLGKKGSFTSHPGRLHEELGIPLGEKVSEERERKALHSSKPQVRRDARAAIGYAHMKHGK